MFLDKRLLLRFLKTYDFDLEKAKNLLIVNLEMRKKHSAIFKKRDVRCEEFQNNFNFLMICPMPQNSRENHKITVYRLIDTECKSYDPFRIFRSFVTTMDVRFINADKNELIDREIGIIDMSGFALGHLIKSISCPIILKNFMKYIQDAAPFTMVQNHFINCSSASLKLVTFMKKFMKKEIVDTLKFHTNIESLYEFVPRELLPNEFGGTAGNLEEIYSDWLQVVENKR